MKTTLQLVITASSLAALFLTSEVTAQTPGPSVAQKMKAIVYHEFGGPEVLRLEEIDKPVPKDNQVLVKVQAASVNALDWRRFTSTSILGRFLDSVLLKAIHTVLGVDIAGRVEAVGGAVKQFQPGDEVFGGCKGAFAEYACADCQRLRNSAPE